MAQLANPAFVSKVASLSGSITFLKLAGFQVASPAHLPPSGARLLLHVSLLQPLSTRPNPVVPAAPIAPQASSYFSLRKQHLQQRPLVCAVFKVGASARCAWVPNCSLTSCRLG